MSTAAENPLLQVVATVGTAIARNPHIMPAKAPAFVIFLEKIPHTYGPMKQPATTPHEKLIILTIIEMLSVANTNEHAINTRHSILVRSICRLPPKPFLSCGARSTEMAEADDSTIPDSVDIDAENSNIIITASMTIVKPPPPSAFISILGITPS